VYRGTMQGTDGEVG